MAASNYSWQAANAARRYPLADDATSVDDAGLPAPLDILTDLHLRFPASLGTVAFVSALTVGPRLLTILIQAAADADSAGGLVPLASVSILRSDLEPSRVYALTPLADGVGGFASFGDVQTSYSGRFSTPRQGLLLSRCARAYSPLPIPSLGKVGRRDTLTGLIDLRASGDLEIVYDVREIAGESRQCVVFRLQGSSVENSVFRQYAGPCGDRPESDTCEFPPLRSFGGATPDCDGNVEVAFLGMLEADVLDCAGLHADHGTGILCVCPPSQVLRFCSTDPCGSSSLALPCPEAEVDDPDVVEVTSSLSSESPPEDIFPLFDHFTEPVSSDFFAFGSWPQEGTIVSGVPSGITPALLAWAPVDTGLVGDESTIVEALLTLSAGAAAGVACSIYLVGSYPIYTGPGQYMSVYLDQATNKLVAGFVSFNTVNPVVTATPLRTIKANKAYTLRLSLAESGGQTTVVITVTSTDDTDWLPLVVNTQTNVAYFRSSGRTIGLSVIRGVASFDTISAERGI